MKEVAKRYGVRKPEVYQAFLNEPSTDSNKDVQD